MENQEYVEINGVNYYRLCCCDPESFVNNGLPIHKVFWKHKDCEGGIYIGDNACLYCEKCGHISHLRNVIWHSPNTSLSSDSYVVSFYNTTPYSPYTRDIIGSVILENLKYGGVSWILKFWKQL